MCTADSGEKSVAGQAHRLRMIITSLWAQQLTSSHLTNTFYMGPLLGDSSVPEIPSLLYELG